MYSDIEVRGDRIDEENEVLLVMGQEKYLEEVERLILDERNKPKKDRRFLRISREHYNEVSKIYHTTTDDYVRKFAQRVIRDLLLEQSNPWSGIDAPMKTDEDGSYLEVDSYTGAILDKISDEEERQSWGDRVAPKVPHLGNELTNSIVSAYNAIGAKGKTIAQAIQASFGNEDDNDEIVHFEDRGMASEPLNQNIEREYPLEPHVLAEVRERMRPFVRAYQERRSETFELFKIKPSKEKWRVRFRRIMQIALERSDFLDEIQKVVIDYGPQYGALSFLALQNEDWGLLMNDALDIEVETDELIPVNITHLAGNRVITSENINPDDDDQYRENFINMDNFGTLYDFIMMYGDELLDISSGGLTSSEMRDSEIRSIADMFTNQILQNIPKEHPKISWTRDYAEGVITTSDSNLTAAGYDNWRGKQSRAAALAFNIAFETEKANGKSVKQARKAAWRAFYSTGRVTTVRKSGLVITSDVTGEPRDVNYSLAVWKLKRGEIALNYEDRARLKDILTRKGWGAKLVKAL